MRGHSPLERRPVLFMWSLLMVMIALVNMPVTMVDASLHEVVIDAASGEQQHQQHHQQQTQKQHTQPSYYGMDRSWPMQHASIAQHDDRRRRNAHDDNDDGGPSRHVRQRAYEEYMSACQQYHASSSATTHANAAASCQESERNRIAMNREQPSQMFNYTHTGFAKMKAPSYVTELLTRIWKEQRSSSLRVVVDQNGEEEEKASKGDEDNVQNVERDDNILSQYYHAHEEPWHSGDIHVNHWQTPTLLLDLQQQGKKDRRRDDSSMMKQQESNATTTTTPPPLPMMHPTERDRLVSEVHDVLEAWTQQPLALTSLYGIRIYQQGAMLAPHVDRLPLVISAIIHVAQEEDYDRDDDMEPWILEVVDHEGRAHNVTTEPGDMILYESSSILHGRPYPLQQSYHANLFLHFEPLGHSYQHAIRTQQSKERQKEDSKSLYEQAMEHWQQWGGSKDAVAINRKDHGDRQSNDHDNWVDDVPSPDAVPSYVPKHRVAEWKQSSTDFEKNEQISPKPTQVTLGQINIHHAAAEGMLDLIQQIAKTDRSQIFKADPNDWRPLHEAARSGQTKVVEYLLEEGAQVNQRTNDDEGGNALYWAEKKPRENQATIELLQQHGGVLLRPIAEQKSLDRQAKRIANKKKLQKKKAA